MTSALPAGNAGSFAATWAEEGLSVEVLRTDKDGLPIQRTTYALGPGQTVVTATDEKLACLDPGCNEPDCCVAKALARTIRSYDSDQRLLTLTNDDGADGTIQLRDEHTYDASGVERRFIQRLDHQADGVFDQETLWLYDADGFAAAMGWPGADGVFASLEYLGRASKACK